MLKAAEVIRSAVPWAMTNRASGFTGGSGFALGEPRRQSADTDHLWMVGHRKGGPPPIEWPSRAMGPSP
ncbi:MAG: hypothetical protein WKF73_20895 [Nocardioidaceae bacterium]